MKMNDVNTSTIIDDNASLQQFYLLTNELSRIRKVRFTEKLDEADNIEWKFKYRGHPLTLQYSIYSGVSLTPQSNRDAKAANELVVKLKEKQLR
jgi:hypothetical protein